MDRRIEGQGSAEYPWEEENVVPFLKVDQGPEADAHGVRLMRPLQRLPELLGRAEGHGVFGTKMRSVITLAEGLTAQQSDAAFDSALDAAVARFYAASVT